MTARTLWKADSYHGGAWSTCDRCSQRWRRHQMRTEWDHLQVCPPCLDPRPPQMQPPRVYPEGIPFPDARPPQDNPDRLYDDSYLMATAGGGMVTTGLYPIYPSGQMAPLGALSPQPIIENPIPGASDELIDDTNDDVLDSNGQLIATSFITQVAGAPPFPAFPGQIAFDPAEVLLDDITFRTGLVSAPSVTD